MNIFNRIIHEPPLKERMNLSNLHLYLSYDVWPKLRNEDSKEKDFGGKVVIVTGASSGIGRALALEFAEQGAITILAARNVYKLRKLEQEIEQKGGICLSVVVDVRKKEDCEHLISKTVENFGKIDILINNAGISMRAMFADLDLKVLEELMQTNFWGAVYCTKAAMPYLLKSKGSVIGISSITGLTPLPGRTGYAASKHAMDGFFNTLRVENLKKGLHVMLVHPGFTESNVRKAALNAKGEPQGETPRKEEKMMTAEKLAKIVTKATKKRKSNLVLTLEGKAAVWMYRHFPKLSDKLVYNMMSKEPDSPFK